METHFLCCIVQIISCEMQNNQKIARKNSEPPKECPNLFPSIFCHDGVLFWLKVSRLPVYFVQYEPRESQFLLTWFQLSVYQVCKLSVESSAQMMRSCVIFGPHSSPPKRGLLQQNAQQLLFYILVAFALSSIKQTCRFLDINNAPEWLPRRSS